MSKCDIINSRRGKESLKCQRWGFLLFCRYEAWKTEHRQTSSHVCLSLSLSTVLSCTPSLTPSWTCTQMNTLPPHTAMERTEGGGAPIGWCHLCRQLKLRLEIMVTFQERWCHSSTAASSSSCFPSTPGLLPFPPSLPSSSSVQVAGQALWIPVQEN